MDSNTVTEGKNVISLLVTPSTMYFPYLPLLQIEEAQLL